MAFPFHYNVRFEGTFGDTGETWSTGYRLGLHNPDALQELVGARLPDPLDYITNQALPFWRYVVGSTPASASVSTSAWLTAVKCNPIRPDGRYENEETSYALYQGDWPETPLRGTSTTNVLPFQCSLVVTTTTAAQRGYASRGRMFLPGVTGPIGLDGRLSTAQRDAWADKMQQAFLLADASVAGGLNAIWRPCIVSASGNAGAGTLREITGIRVGDVMDTQRRRRESLDENYADRPLAW